MLYLVNVRFENFPTHFLIFKKVNLIFFFFMLFTYFDPLKFKPSDEPDGTRKAIHRSISCAVSSLPGMFGQRFCVLKADQLEDMWFKT